MLNRIAASLGNLLLKAAKNNKRIQVAIFLAIVVPVIVIGVFAYLGAYRDLTEFTFSRRQSIAFLAANALEQRFDRLTDIGLSLATRVRFRQLVSQGKWDEAIEILKDVREDFPFIDRLFLADLTGTLMADTPALPGVRGKNFAVRDWYQGVIKKWSPYISDVYQRVAEPRHIVFAVSVPIKSEGKEIVGILVLQVRLEALIGWSKAVEVGPSGFVYFVDRKGQLAAYPKLPSQENIVDYSSVPLVQKVLRGQSGVEIFFNALENEERIAAYAPISRTGWGVIATEPTRTAFERRDKNLAGLLVRYGFIFLISCILASVIIRALTERKRAEESVRQLNADLQEQATQLEATNKELEAFSYSVSHDLRAPLRSIDGFSQALLEDYGDKLDEEGKDYLQRVRTSTQRMGDLIDDMLKLSRVTRGEMRREPVDLTGMAQALAAELQTSAPDREVEFVIADGLTAQGDARLLRIVLDNLLGNAWKYTSKHPRARIEFGFAQNNGQSAYFVRDDGAGFDMAYADKLFGVFQRLHRQTEFSGTGVGLATVQRIMHRHGGRVWADAQVDKGATFYFTVERTQHER
jgi:signal transduction histidine kinase